MERSRYDEIGAMEQKAIAKAVMEAGKLQNEDRTRMLRALEKVADAAALAARKRRNNARYEARRRRLVGAQVPVELADQVRKAAQMEGVSVYAFVVSAVQRECHRLRYLLEEPPGVTDCPAVGEEAVDVAP